MSRPFVHLHVHSDYSLLDGGCQVDRLVNRAAELGMPALAVTDHGNMYGAIHFYQKALSKGVKPILGTEAYLVSGSRQQKNAQQERRFHLVLLARNNEGYQNLCLLCSKAFTEGFYYKPRIDLELLEKHSSGLIGLSACIQGEVAARVLEGDMAKAEEAALRYERIFGKGNFYLEIQDHGLPNQKLANEGLIEISARTGIPLVATNDCHYMEREDYMAHEVLVCIGTGKTLNDANRLTFDSHDFYFKTAEEMEALFGHIPGALENTVAIAEACQVELDLKSQHYPEFKVPEGYTRESYFEAVTRAGYEERLKTLKAMEEEGRLRYTIAEYDKRLEYEIGVIKRLKYDAYFLIVWDFIRHARENDIPVGPGRGSAAGSLVAYCLKITDVDPIHYDLLFERFLNPERVSPPDIDIDFCTRRREDVIRYVTEKYGHDSVCQIVTFGTMKAKAVVRDVGRVLGLSYSEVDKIAKLIPAELSITLERAVNEEPKLQEAMDADPNIRTLIEISKRLEGLSRHKSIHAAGVVIAPKPLQEIIPLTIGDTGELVTQYAKEAVEKLGLLKMDFLGLITLTVIYDALAMIRKNHGIDVDIDRIPLDDPATYKLFADGRTAGVFQFESSGMRNYLRGLKPTCLEDITAMNALYRPGPIKGGMIEDFISRKHGLSPIEYLVPELEPLLNNSYGVILYQEQVMQVAFHLAGFTMGEADTLRKAMGKKQMDVMAKMEEKFIEGSAQRGINKGKAAELFEKMRNFAEYGFNKSHAAAYAWVAYQTAFLKANYPSEFMAALLTSVKDKTDDVVKYISECKAMGIPILPPSINESETDFVATKNGIRFGLGALKNVGGAALEVILRARQADGPFKSFTDFCCRVDRSVNSRVLDSLIKAGVFDELGYRRSQLSQIMDGTLEYAQRQQKNLAIGQASLFDFGEEEQESGAGTAESLPDIPEWDPKLILSCEKEILGFYISGHPLEEFADLMGTCTDTTLDQLSEETVGKTARIGCVISELRMKKTQKGDRMAVGTLEDMTGTADFVIFPKAFNEYEALVKTDLPLLVTGNCEQEESGNFKVMVNELHPLSGARDLKVSKIRLEMDLGLVRPDAARLLTEILAENRGDCSVEVLLRKRGVGTAFLEANEYLRVRWSSDLKQKIEGVTYPGVVRYL